MKPIQIALLGAGIFARDDHLPALRALAQQGQFEVAAIYSRTLQKAAALAASLPNPPAIYDRLEDVLAHPGLEAVDVLLPIPVQPQVVLAALRAGKHVISEKPVAPGVSEGQALLQEAEKLSAPAGLVWMVAENLRYAPAYRAAAQALRAGQIGRPVQFSWAVCGAMDASVKYYHTPWRRDNSYQGGFVLDGGVHSIAVLRTLMGEVQSVAAFAVQRRPDLPPVDTLSATLRFESGAFGTFAITFAAGQDLETDLLVTGDAGWLSARLGRLEVSGPDGVQVRTFEANLVEAELADFASAVRHGTTPASPPAEALRDVALVEAMLQAARTGAVLQPARI